MQSCHARMYSTCLTAVGLRPSRAISTSSSLPMLPRPFTSSSRNLLSQRVFGHGHGHSHSHSHGHSHDIFTSAVHVTSLVSLGTPMNVLRTCFHVQIHGLRLRISPNTPINSETQKSAPLFSSLSSTPGGKNEQ